MASTASDIRATLDRLAARKKAYMAIPQEALDDLVGFCRGEMTCWDPDARIHAAKEGRREVWLRIRQHQTLSPEELLILYTNGEHSAAELEGTEHA